MWYLRNLVEYVYESLLSSSRCFYYAKLMGYCWVRIDTVEAEIVPVKKRKAVKSISKTPAEKSPDTYVYMYIDTFSWGSGSLSM